MFKDETGEIVLAIVSEELWEQANAVLMPSDLYGSSLLSLKLSSQYGYVVLLRTSLFHTYSSSFFFFRSFLIVLSE